MRLIATGAVFILCGFLTVFGIRPVLAFTVSGVLGFLGLGILVYFFMKIGWFPQ